MTDRENFLERWSRKKLEPEREQAAPDAAASRPDAAAPRSPGAAGDLQLADDQRQATQPREAEFDITSLPSLDSITRATDIRAFLQPGVPLALTRAALRRAWVADPAIRDFVGLQENDWDFTNPDAMPGFGEIAPGYDIKKMVAQLFGEPERSQAGPVSVDQVPAQAPTQPAQVADGSETAAGPAATAATDRNVRAEAPPIAITATSTVVPSPSVGAMVHRDNIIAMQNIDAEQQCVQPKFRRPHGGALPK